MSCRLASVALVFALAAHIGMAAGTEPAPAGDVDRMTPAQLRELQAKLDRQSAAARGENAALSRRIEELEQRNAALGAKKADLEARLADVLERLSRLEAPRAN